MSRTRVFPKLWNCCFEKLMMDSLNTRVKLRVDVNALIGSHVSFPHPSCLLRSVFLKRSPCLSEHVPASVLALCYYTFIISALWHRSADQKKPGLVFVLSQLGSLTFKKLMRAVYLSASEHKSMHILSGTCRNDSLFGVSRQPDKYNDTGCP